MNLKTAVAALAFCVCYDLPGVAAVEKGQPDVNKMTLDELLNEFHHPPEGVESKPPPPRRIDVINALRKIRDPLVAKLKDDLKNSNPAVRIAAEQVLANMGEVARLAVPEIAKAMDDPNEDVRWWAVMAISHLRDPRAFYSLVKATTDPSPRVRSVALVYAATCFSDAAFATAVVALADKEKTVRKAAIGRLNMLKDKRAVPLLMPLLGDSEVHSSTTRNGITTADRNCDEVVLALEHILRNRVLMGSEGTQEENDQKVKEWRQWWEEHGHKFIQELYAEPELRRPF